MYRPCAMLAREHLAKPTSHLSTCWMLCRREGSRSRHSQMLCRVDGRPEERLHSLMRVPQGVCSVSSPSAREAYGSWRCAMGVHVEDGQGCVCVTCMEVYAPLQAASHTTTSFIIAADSLGLTGRPSGEEVYRAGDVYISGGQQCYIYITLLTSSWSTRTLH